MKKLSFLFLTLMACVAFANATVYNGTCGAEGDDVIWQLNTSNGELVISGNGAMADYGFNSTPWYEYRDSITSVIIGNSITSIGDYAFSNCSGLTSVTIPNSVTSIGGYAFTSCVNLPSVNIPNNVTSIGSGAFNECHSLTSVNIPGGITDIENNLFLNCKALPSITLPESVTSIGSQAFANCSTLVSINIPQGVTKIDRAAFSYCISLTSLTIPESVTSIGEIAFIHVENVIYSGTATGAPWGAKCMNGYSEGWLAYSDSSKSRLVACSDGAIGDIIIPESVKTIDDQAFSWCSKITSVVIPQDITSIGRMVFYYCTDLLSVTIPSTVTSIGEAAFGNCNKLASIIIPDNVTNIGDFAFSNCKSLTSITIPENVTSIGERAFFDCNGFTSVTCEAIEPPTLGASVFRDDFLMYEPFSIPLYVPAQSIDRYNAADQWKDFNVLPIENEPEPPCLIASGTCGAEGDNLTWELDCEGMLTISGTGAMDQYNDFEESRHAPWYDYKETLNAVKIGNGVTDIGYGAFEYHDCPNCHVSEIHFEGTIEEWCSKNWSPSNIAQHGYNLYIQNKEVTDLVIPNTITQIGDNAFQGCNSLKSVDISEGVTSIEEYAFHGCINLVSVVIPNSVTSIGERVFDECSRLTSITIPNSVTSIEISTFQNCNSLTSLEIPNSVTTIKNRAFQGSGLTSIVIPNSVTVIGEGAFYGCNLNTIVIPSSITSIEKSTFENCHNLTSVEIPISITQIGQNAFKNCNGLETVTIPTNVTNIGLQAFYKCTGLTSITCEAVTPPTLGSNVFGNVNKSIPLYVPAQSVDLYKAADQWKDFTNILPIGGYSSISLPIHIELIDNYGWWLSEAAISNELDTAFFYSSSFDYSEYVVHAYKTEDNLWRLIGYTTPEYRFIGWKDKDGKVLNQDTLCLYSNDTVIAIVSKQKYHVQVVPDNYMHGYTKAEYGYAGDTTISYGESINVTAIPREGFQFSNWSDGNTDNPREINILGDLYLTAIFDCQRYGGGWPSEILDTITIERGDPVVISEGFPWQRTIYPNETDYFNDTLRSIFGCDSIVTHYVIVTENKFPVIFLNYNGKVLSRQYVRNGMGAEEPEVPVREGYTFTGWTTDIEHIVDTTYAIAVYDKIGGTVIYKAEDGEIIGSENVDLHLPAAPMISGKTFAGWLTESVDSESGIVLRATYTTDNPTTHDDVSVVPGSTTAAVNFPYITGALTYELVIRDLFGHVVCKILFSSTGHLLGIALAPGRNRTAAPAQTDGFNFTVEGLDPNTTYNYEFVAHDDTDEVIETLSGSFTTTDDISTDVENVQSNNAQCSKVLRNDHVYILRGEKVYSIDGQEVK